MIHTEIDLEPLRAAHPEWQPWLTVLGAVLREAEDPVWESFVPELRSERRPGAPRLAGAAIVLSAATLLDWLKRLMRSAAAGGTPELATLSVAAPSADMAAQLFSAGVRQDTEALNRFARDCGANAMAFEGVAELLPMPFLQACGRHLARGGEGEAWQEGYCPTCGAWPVFAEVRGIERARYLRCGRCGDEWQLHWLTCPFCGASDHTQIASLIPAAGDDTRSVDACKRCAGYLKSFTVLQGAARLDVAIKDLASVDLDLAAMTRGYRRPPPGRRLHHLSVGHKTSVLARLFPRGR